MELEAGGSRITLELEDAGSRITSELEDGGSRITLELEDGGSRITFEPVTDPEPDTDSACVPAPEPIPSLNFLAVSAERFLIALCELRRSSSSNFNFWFFILVRLALADFLALASSISRASLICEATWRFVYFFDGDFVGARTRLVFDFPD